jgi:protease-4
MKNLLLFTLAVLIALALFAAGLLFLVFVGVSMLAAGSVPYVPDNCIVTVDLTQPVQERTRLPDPFTALQGGADHPLAAHEIASALRAVAEDERVAGVLLRGQVNGPTSALSEARAALAEVRAAGKPVLAYYGSPAEPELWFASVADELWMEPLGEATLDGLAVVVPYFGDALARYGIEVQVTRVGKYKSAVEPYLLGEMSVENREQLEALLGDIQDTLYGEIAAARGIAREELERLSRERGWLKPEEAHAAGLVTRVAPFAELLAHLRELTGTDEGDEVPQVALHDYALDVGGEWSSGAGVQVIVAAGEIVDGTSFDQIGGDDLARELRAAREDEDTAAVVLRVDSPGGSATASDVIRAEVRALGAAGKPVVVSMGSMAASGGYWISAEADKIVAQPESLTGSIGVFGMLPNIEALAERHGLRAEVVRSSPYAGLGSLWKRKDEAQMARLQELVDRVYERFVALVADGRKMAPERVEEIAQGRVWSGARALELGLVDELGGLTRAIALARERAGLDEDAPVRFGFEELHPFDELVREFATPDPEPLVGAMVRELGPLRDVLSLLERARRLAGESGLVARLPFDLAPR